MSASASSSSTDDDGASEPDEAAAGEPQISLHAIAGVRTSETMQMHLTLGGVSLLTIIDSGSTHNFIAEEVAARTMLPPPLLGQLRVTMANGKRVPCHGVYLNV